MDAQTKDCSNDRSTLELSSIHSSVVEGLDCISITDAADHWGTAQPDIEIIHVLAFGSVDNRLRVGTLFTNSVRSERREYVFKCHGKGLLAGGLIKESIENQASELLRQLSIHQQQNETGNRKIIVFVAYDFGALVLKQSISIAHKNRSLREGILSRVARFVFAGCFQRASDTSTLMSTIFDYLRSQGGFLSEWPLIPATICGLFDSLSETNENFLLSKVTLRSKVISLCAVESGTGQLHAVFDRETGSLGLQDENVIFENPQVPDHPFPELANIISRRIDDWLPRESLIPLELTLHALAPAPQTLKSMCLVESHPIFCSTKYIEWTQSRETCVLYIDGESFCQRNEAVEQVLLKWRSERRTATADESEPLVVHFRFSSMDPKRSTIKEPLVSLLFSHLTGNASNKSDEMYELLEDQFHLHHTWTDQDLLQLLTVSSAFLVDQNTLLILEDMDECQKDSRQRLWKALDNFANSTERPLKVVITCKMANFRLNDFEDWPGVPVKGYSLPVTDNSPNNKSGVTHLDGLIAVLCPGGHGEAKILEHLQRLVSMDPQKLGDILAVLQRLSNWPKELSVTALDRFCGFLQRVTLSSNPSEILDLALRDVSDRIGLQWVLCCILHAYRPLTLRELSQAFCYCERDNKRLSFDPPSEREQQQASELILSWTSHITEVYSGRVHVRRELESLLDKDSRYIWNELGSPENLFQFVMGYLTAPQNLNRLQAIFDSYLATFRSSGVKITPPLIGDGEDIIFYAIESLPYHLPKAPELLKNLEEILVAKDGKLSPWSQVYWAMSNPFSRPDINKVDTPCATLLALCNLDPAVVETLKGFQSAPYTKDRENSHRDILTTNATLESLDEAMRKGDEELSISLASTILATHRQDMEQQEPQRDSNRTSEHIWPTFFLWRATWLNMPRLVALILEDTSPNPGDGASLFFPSPLYMASRICQGPVINALLDRGARMNVKRKGTYSPLFTASASGNIHGVEALISRDRSLLDTPAPEEPLCIASSLGQWKVVERLLQFGAKPDGGVLNNTPDGVWAPLVVAADGGHIKTAGLLLESDANPDILGPYSNDTPLWFAALRAASLECVSLLLQKGADPNHPSLNPPLLIEVVKSTLPTENRIRILNALLDNDPPANVNATDVEEMSALLHAAKQGDLPILKLLLERGAHIDAKDKTGYCALAYSAKHNHVEVMQQLLTRSPALDVRTSNEESLLDLAMDNIQMMTMLLNAGLDPDLCGRDNLPVINIAVDKKEIAVVKLLVERNADLDHFDQWGWNPILDATGYVPSPEITRILAENGANLSVTTERRSTPLHLAAGQDSSVVRVLLEFRKSFDIEARTLDDRTPLLVAAEWSNLESAQLLIRAGADVNTTNSDGWTPLMFALRENKSPELVDLLLSQMEIVISSSREDIITPLILACEQQDFESVVKLMDKGADPNGSYADIAPTPLIATCLSKTNPDSSDDKIHQIVRYLVTQGADVNAVHGPVFYSALLAASLAGSTQTIRLLIDEGAALDRPDPLGRLPIHFAAAGGIENFQTVNAYYTGDLLVSDFGGKNVLHWAAQFGQVNTVKAILDLLDPSGRDRKRYINLPDIDGWTPLCWATRPSTEGYFRLRLSEPPQYVETVGYLIKQGASCSVKFYQGLGQDREEFTPAKMARLCGADQEMVEILQKGTDTDTEMRGKRSRRKYISGSGSCDICFNMNFGKSYHCQSCPDFDACKKCYGRIDIYNHLDGEKHTFKPNAWREEEFEEVLAQSDDESDGGNRCQSPGVDQASNDSKEENTSSGNDRPTEEADEISSIDSEDLELSDNE